MTISPQRLTIYLHSAHRAVIFAIEQLSCFRDMTHLARKYLVSQLALHATYNRRFGRQKSKNVAYYSFRGLWCIGVCMIGCLGTSLITSSQPLMRLLAVFIYDLLTWIVSLFLAADLARTVVGLFITLVRHSGTTRRTYRNSDSFDGFITILENNATNALWRDVLYK